MENMHKIEIDAAQRDSTKDSESILSRLSTANPTPPGKSIALL